MPARLRYSASVRTPCSPGFVTAEPAHNIDLNRLLTVYGTWLAGRIDAAGTAMHEPWTELVEPLAARGRPA
jgi:hypothetical protein